MSRSPLLPLTAITGALAACAPGGAIQTLGPNVYQITHTMYKNSPVKGVRKGVIERAQTKCAETQGTYEKVREEMTPGGTLSYTLTFRCNYTAQFE